MKRLANAVVFFAVTFLSFVDCLAKNNMNFLPSSSPSNNIDTLWELVYEQIQTELVRSDGGIRLRKLPLWPIGNPSSNGLESLEKVTDRRVEGSATGEITLFLPPKVSGKTTPLVVICPGGGYANLAMGHEGYDVAEWFLQQGIGSLVLKYRMPNQFSFIPLSDVQQALKLARYFSKSWNVDPNKIGVMGFSAGGHLAASASNYYEVVPPDHFHPFSKISAKPNFSILIYPVVSMADSIAHKGSKRNLLGNQPADSLVRFFSMDRAVGKHTPPTFLMHSTDDRSVVIENSRLYYEALQKSGVPAYFSEFPSGGHGWGMRSDASPYQTFLQELQGWLKKQKLIL